MNCSFCAAAGAVNAAPDKMAAASISRLRAIFAMLMSSSLSPSFLVRGICFLFLCQRPPSRYDLGSIAPSIGKRPKSELFLANRYQPGEPTGFFDEKIADQRSKDD